MDIRLYRQPVQFVLMSDDPSIDYRIEILDIYFRTCRIAVSSGVLIGHNKALEIGPAIYPIVKTLVRTASVVKGQTSFAWDNLQSAPLPGKIIIGMISNEALTGSYSLNPFNFQTFNISSLGVYLDNVSVPAQPFKFDLGGQKGQCFIQAFSSLSEIVGKDLIDSNIGIDRDDWNRGYALVGVQLTPTFGAEEYADLPKEGSLRLEIAFSSPLTESITIVLYTEMVICFKLTKAVL